MCTDCFRNNFPQEHGTSVGVRMEQFILAAIQEGDARFQCPSSWDCPIDCTTRRPDMMWWLGRNSEDGSLFVAGQDDERPIKAEHRVKLPNGFPVVGAIIVEVDEGGFDNHTASRDTADDERMSILWGACQNKFLDKHVPVVFVRIGCAEKSYGWHAGAPDDDYIFRSMKKNGLRTGKIRAIPKAFEAKMARVMAAMDEAHRVVDEGAGGERGYRVLWV